jgi:hypothetical protein
MGDPGRAPRFPGVRNCVRGVGPVPGRRSDRKPRSTLATTFYGPDRTDQKTSSCGRACGPAAALLTARSSFRGERRPLSRAVGMRRVLRLMRPSTRSDDGRAGQVRRWTTRAGAAAFPSLPELRGGYCPCPGRHSERKRPSTPANMSNGPGRTNQKKSSCSEPDPYAVRGSVRNGALGGRSRNLPEQFAGERWPLSRAVGINRACAPPRTPVPTRQPPHPRCAGVRLP